MQVEPLVRGGGTVFLAQSIAATGGPCGPNPPSLAIDWPKKPYPLPSYEERLSRVDPSAAWSVRYAVNTATRLSFLTRAPPPLVTVPPATLKGAVNVVWPADGGSYLF